VCQSVPFREIPESVPASEIEAQPRVHGIFHNGSYICLSGPHAYLLQPKSLLQFLTSYLLPRKFGGRGCYTSSVIVAKLGSLVRTMEADPS